MVNLCALDISKAFDKVSHYVLFMKLMERKIPVSLFQVLVHWYSPSTAVVKWQSVRSYVFQLHSGVRQGGVLSPVLFSVYVNSLIDALISSGLGCHVAGVRVGCVMYADDLLLMSGSLHNLQLMTDICCSEITELELVFNPNKCQVIRIGSKFNETGCVLHVMGTVINYVTQFKYLVWYIISAKSFKISFHHLRARFYQCFNSIHVKGHNFTEPVLLRWLIRTASHIYYMVLKLLIGPILNYLV